MMTNKQEYQTYSKKLEVMEDDLSIFSDALEELNKNGGVIDIDDNSLPKETKLQVVPFGKYGEKVNEVIEAEKAQSSFPTETQIEKRTLCDKCNHEITSDQKSEFSKDSNEESKATEGTSPTRSKSEESTHIKPDECSVASVHKAKEDSDNDDESSEKDKESSKLPKHQRWSRDNDKTLFCCLQNLEGHGIITRSEICNLTNLSVHYFSDGVRLLADLSNWKGPLQQLVKRVQFLCKEQKFTARELKLFKRLLKLQVKSKELDLKKLLYEFPGKSLDFIDQSVRKTYNIKEKGKQLKISDLKTSRKSKQ